MITFRAAPYKIKSWIVILVPKDESLQLPSRGQVLVKGTLNGVEFMQPLEPDGAGSHWINIDKSMMGTAKIVSGKDVTVEIEASKDWPEPVIPNDVQKGIVDNPKTSHLWNRVTPMARWEWLRWINSTNNPETRKNRIEVSCSKLLNGLRRPCCFNRNMCCVPDVAKNGVLLGPDS